MQTKTEKRCLVLGGCGFLGAAVVRNLVSQGWQVRVFDKEGVDPWRLESVLPGIDLVTGDFFNAADLNAAVADIPTVLHFIGTTIPQSSMNDIHYDIETNVLPTIRLLELMRKNPGSRLIFASSGGTVYGIAGEPRPFKESDPENPISSYGVSKLMIEKYIKLFSHNFGLPYTILRFANPYGESQYIGRPLGAVSVFLHKVLNREEIVVWGDGSVVRDYIYEADIAAVVLKVLENETVSGVYNVGSGTGTSLNGLLETIFSITGGKCPVTYKAARRFDVPYNVLDIKKIYAAFGWEPRYTLDAGLRNILRTPDSINFSGAVL